MQWIEIPSVVTANIELIANVVSAIGTNDFDLALLQAINQIAPVMEVSGYACKAGIAPINVGWCGMSGDTPIRIEKYINDAYYKFDPILISLPQQVALNTNFVRVFYAHSISHETYRSTFFEQPKFKTEVGVIHKEKDGWGLIKVFTDKEVLSNETILQLGEVGALLYPIARKHAYQEESNLSSFSRPKALDRLLLKLKNRFPQLTDREVQVCALTILGSSAPKIATKLNLSSNTIVTYRRRAYDKLGVSNANTLMKELI